MLEELRLRGLGVLDAAVLELGPGFTVITGETGAGKTMVLTGIGLLLGGRADAALVRSGAPRAEVEGRVRVDGDGALASRVLDAGGHLDDEVLVIARSVGADGRSRAYLGGRSVPVGLLGELADELVAVHGQADQRGLLRASVQRAVLDRYAGPEVEAALGTYRQLFSELSTVQAQLVEVTARRRERTQEHDLLSLGLAEIDAVKPQAGEDTALRAEITRLAHVDALRVAVEGAREPLSAADPDTADALSLIGGARQRLADVHGRDASVDALESRLAEASYLLSDVAADLGAYAAGLEADPLRLEAAQRRFAALATLTRKYGGDPAPADIDTVLAWAANARTRLELLSDDDERVDALRSRHQQLLHEVSSSAAVLSAARTAAAARLSAAATAELVELAMPRARLAVAVRQRDDETGLQVQFPDGARRVAFGASGVDDVEMLLAAHPNAPFRPLHRGASGGELSRVMLALEVALAGSDPVATFVFDEVDAGVGGRAAVEVGRRLAELARHAQVIVVTHLPQVAAFADHHVVVDKSDDPSATTTDVRTVTGTDRLEELSRMLAGLPDSELGRGHAEELLAVASAAKLAG